MTEEQLFREWITENWQDQYHNFSKLENGHYYFSSMQDACGGCLQVIAEYELKQNQKIRIILYSDTNQVMIAEGGENFLPMIFLF